VDVNPRLVFSESDEARSKELEADLTNQSLGIGSLVPASDTDDPVLFGNGIENAKGVDLSGGPADAVVGKFEANGFLEVGHCDGWMDGWIDRDGQSRPAFILASFPIKLCTLRARDSVALGVRVHAQPLAVVGLDRSWKMWAGRLGKVQEVRGNLPRNSICCRVFVFRFGFGYRSQSAIHNPLPYG